MTARGPCVLPADIGTVASVRRSFCVAAGTVLQSQDGDDPFPGPVVALFRDGRGSGAGLFPLRQQRVPGEEVVEGLPVALRNGNVLPAEDDAVALDGADLCRLHDVGAVHADEAVGGQLLLERLEAHEREHRARFTLEMDLHVVLQPLDVEILSCVLHFFCSLNINTLHSYFCLDYAIFVPNLSRE